MPIVLHIVNMMDGEINIDSDKDEGTCITVNIPMKIAFIKFHTIPTTQNTRVRNAVANVSKGCLKFIV